MDRQLPNVHFGEPGPDDEDDPDETDPDVDDGDEDEDEELEDTPPDVIAMLGFDPKEKD